MLFVSCLKLGNQLKSFCISVHQCEGASFRTKEPADNRGLAVVEVAILTRLQLDKLVLSFLGTSKYLFKHFESAYKIDLQ